MSYRAITLACSLMWASSAVTAADPEPSAKRPLPDYDGRGNPDADADHLALWIPRIALSPLYVVNEVVLRRGMGAVVKRMERDRWFDEVADIFRFGSDNQNLIIPTALVDFGLRPSVGFYFSADDMFTDSNSVRLSASTGGISWLTATALDRYTWSNGGATLSGRFEFTRRPDYLFYGIGPDVRSNTRSRYLLQRIEGSWGFRRRLVGESAIGVGAGVRGMSVRSGTCCGDPAVEDLIMSGALPPLPGLGTSYTIAFQRAELILDSRPPRPAPATGGFLRVHGETDIDVASDRRWVNYGSVVGGAVDLDGLQRELRLQLAVSFVDPITGDASMIPFNELAQLGSDLMPGFLAGWMNGRSTFATQLGYTWPAWLYLDGQARLAAGNAFDQHLDGLAIKKLRLSADVGVTTIGARDAGFEILFGVGTETIEHGAGITSVRLTFGSRRGF